jgi:NAD(P)-dependent dehydrogenase (short-subunit alcohol dehydrogenase family)
MSQTVLVTGAFGLVGSATVRRFAADGWRVIATAHRKADDALTVTHSLRNYCKLAVSVGIRQSRSSYFKQLPASMGSVTPVM